MRDVVREASVATAPSTDRRSVRTRRALRDALAREIEQTGDLSQVTVTAVTERADVTRRTFYSHFRDIPDLVGSVEAETLEELRPLVADLASVDLERLSSSVERLEACPGAIPILEYFRAHGGYLAALLGDGGDPGFSKRIQDMVREVVSDRALMGIDLRAIGAFFDYYLTYAIAAEVGVLVRWLTTGMHESVDAMGRIMTALMFVRPGDLYGTTINFDIQAFASDLMLIGEEDDD